MCAWICFQQGQTFVRSLDQKDYFGKEKKGLLVIWPGESAVFSFGEDRL